MEGTILIFCGAALMALGILLLILHLRKTDGVKGVAESLKTSNPTDRSGYGQQSAGAATYSGQTANMGYAQTGNPNYAQTANMGYAQTGDPNYGQTASMGYAQTGNPNYAPTANVGYAQTGNPNYAPTANMGYAQTGNPNNPPQPNGTVRLARGKQQNPTADDSTRSLFSK